MKKRLLAVFLLLCMLLSGCDLLAESYITEKFGPKFSDFTYSRPDLAQMEETLEACRTNIQNDRELSDILTNISTFYTQYDSFYTNLNLADIHYCMDMSNTQWSDEYQYCTAATAEVESMLEQLYSMLAQSGYRQDLEKYEYFPAGFLDAYIEEPVYDEKYISLSREESRLQALYYDVFVQAGDLSTYSQEFYDAYGLELVQILLDLIEIRQQIAEHLGAESYSQLSYESMYNRTYTAKEAMQYMKNIGIQLSDIYDTIYFDEVWDYGAVECDPADTFRYVQNTARYLGPEVQNAFATMDARELYNLSYSPYQYDGAFCTYLWDYHAPYVFISPWYDMSDKLSFAHEFGHFANAYILDGGYVNMDISEVQSQGMEYMSLCYAKDQKLTQYKLADSLDVYISQSAFGLFELEIYELKGDELTVENVISCYRHIAEDFALDQDGWNEMEFVNISHFYDSPMYIVSYVVSNDLAMQLYEVEMQDSGAGKKKYVDILYSEEDNIQDFAEQYDLKDPFSEERLAEIRYFFEKTFLLKSQAA